MLKMPMTAIALVALAAIAACESNGHTRYASVGTVGPGGSNGGSGQNGGDGGDGSNGGSGVPGPAGPSGPSGPTGPTGAQGEQGEPGGNFALGNTGLIATGGLVGPSGVGGTGLLANLGDPSTSLPVVSDVSASGGNLITSVSAGLDGALGQANLPTELASVTGAVTQTLTGVGGALEAFGTDGTPLIDGLASSVSPLLTAGLGGGTLVGDDSGSSLIGLSLLSPDQQMGSLAEVGIASGTSLLNADLSPDSDTALNVANLASVDLGPVTGAVNGALGDAGLSDVTGVIEGVLGGGGDLGSVTAPVEGLLSGGGLLTGVTEPVENLLTGEGALGGLTEPVEDILSGNEEAPETPLDPVVSGVTGVLGGLLGGGWN